MTAFNKSELTSGEYMMYNQKFVARRFKHKGPITKAKFVKELVKNHTVEGYFAELDSGKAPFTILRDANPDWYYEILRGFRDRSFAQ